MSSSAQVRSTEAIERFRGALAKFEERTQATLETLNAELQRAAQWLQYDRPAFWKGQIKKAEDGVHQAKLELERCLLFTLSGERPACREQRDALKKAKQHLEYCREKSERVRHWQRELQHQMYEYEARIGALQRMLEIELPAARARLQGLVRRLDDYRIERPPRPESSPRVNSAAQTKKQA